MQEIFQIIALSLYVSFFSTIISSFFGFIFGTILTFKDFPFKNMVSKIVDTSMSLPPVLMGLIVYLLLSRSGPLGNLRLLFTKEAMILAQVFLITPVITSLVSNHLSTKGRDIIINCKALGAKKKDIYIILFKESIPNLTSIVSVGFGRSISEVGAVMMVGGNIRGTTRVMTTYIAMETGKGNFNDAIFIGISLLLISFTINWFLHKIKKSYL